eukprot:13759027-Alexandrium_andersonii.AAC.1
MLLYGKEVTPQVNNVRPRVRGMRNIDRPKPHEPVGRGRARIAGLANPDASKAPMGWPDACCAALARADPRLLQPASMDRIDD